MLSALWGGSYLFMRLAIVSLSPFVIAEFRLFIASIFLGILLLCKNSWRQYLYLPRRLWPKLLFIAIFNAALPFTVIAYAIQFINAGTGAILNSTSPLWSALIATIWFKDRLTFSRILGLFVGFIGVVFLMWGKASLGSTGTGLAILAAMVGTLSYGISTNFLKHYAQGLHPLTVTFWSLFISFLLLLVPASLTFDFESITVLALLGVIGLGVLSTAIANILFFGLAERISPTIAITVTFLVPVFSMLWGDLFLQEHVTLRMLLGALIVLVGTALVLGLISFRKIIRLFSKFD